MNSWTGTTYPNPTIFDQCCSGGPGVAMNTNTNTLRFSYGQSTATQAIAINTAMAAAGTGVKVIGYNYSWQIMNDLNNGGGTRGTLTGLVTLTGVDNSILKSYSYNYSNLNTGGNFQLITGTETFGPQYDPSALKNLTVSFTGKDQNWWAGYYGPRVREPDVRLNYMVDPCVGNPAFSPSCPGFSSVKTSGNLGQYYAIRTALEHSGTGLIIHGFDYGFNWKTGENCTAEFIICWAYGPAATGASVTVTNSSGGLVANKNYGWYSQNQSGNMTDSIRFPTSLNQLTLGNFAISGGGEGGGYISNVWSRMVYSPDPCETNPLYSSNCKKFVSTVLDNQKTAQQTTTTDTSVVNQTTTSLTSPTAMADPVKNEVTNTNVGGVQMTTSGEIVPVTAVPQVVRVVSEPVQVTKEKEKEKPVIVKPPVIPAPVVTARKSTVDDGTSVALSAAAQSVYIEPVQSSQQMQGTQSTVAIQQQSSLPLLQPKVTQQIQTFTAQEQVTDLTVMGSQLRAASSSSRKVVQEQFVLPEIPKELAAQQDEVTTRTMSGQGLSVASIPLALRPITTFNVEFPQISSSFATSRTNPLNSVLEQRPTETTSNEKSETVKKNVQNNELAGGVDISKIAIQPVGFNSYLSLTLTDTAFYGAKEVYQNQRVVDNARAQKLLQGASDKLHQEMVNSQYK
jgi:hypothetical protein